MLQANPRALLARVRSELHRLLGALARREWADALEGILPADEAGETWTEDRLKAQLQAFFDEHADIDARPAARAPSNTTLAKEADHLWAATQKLIDPEGNDEWAIFASIDLSPEARADLPEEAPVLTLRRIGV
jgi:hypothetical protein